MCLDTDVKTRSAINVATLGDPLRPTLDTIGAIALDVVDARFRHISNSLP